MGLTSNMALILLREHRYRPFSGNLLSIGRQTCWLDEARATALVARECGRLRPDRRIELDRATLAAQGTAFITDSSFYSLFCDIRYSAIDVSAYEGADVVWDLCEPVPEEFERRYDIVYDGGALDNMFDPATAIKNIARMLKPGGRVVHVERVSSIFHNYSSFSLAWFWDYYALNEFADCKVYLTLWDGARESPWDVYYLDPIAERDGKPEYFGIPQSYDRRRDAHVVVVAEKGDASTWRRNPVQFTYRSGAAVSDIYAMSALRFAASPRPLLAFGGAPAPQNTQYRPCGVANATAG